MDFRLVKNILTLDEHFFCLLLPVNNDLRRFIDVEFDYEWKDQGKTK